MASVENPIKVFKFQIEMDGLLQMEAQTMTLPTMEIEATEHGDTNHSIKTPGRIIVGDLVMTKLKPVEGNNNVGLNWMLQCQDAMTGGGALPVDCKRTVIIRELDPSGVVAVNSYLCIGVFPKRIEWNDKDRSSSDNVIETVTYSVDRMRPI